MSGYADGMDYTLMGYIPLLFDTVNASNGTVS